MKSSKNQKIKIFILKNLILFIVMAFLLLALFYIVSVWFFWTRENSFLSKSVKEQELPIEELVEKSDQYFNLRNETLVLIDENMEIIQVKGQMKDQQDSLLFSNYIYGFSYETEMDYYIDSENAVYGIGNEMEYEGQMVRGIIIANLSDSMNKKMIRLSMWISIINFVATLLIIILLMVVIINRTYKKIRSSFDFIGKSIEEMPYLQQKIEASPKDFLETKNIVISFNRMIDEMHRINREKKEAVEQSDRLISNLSHDLKSPLTSIKGYSDILANDKLNDDEITQYAKYINNSVIDLDYLTNMLFEQIKLKNSDYSLNIECLDINEFVRNICANYYSIFQNRGFNLTVDIEENVLKVCFDPYNFKRVITNILDNACNHNEQKTNVSVSVKKQDEYVVICVKDDGVGIPNESKTKIFEPFYQVDSSRSKNNSGLGLYVAKQIMVKHKGSIDLVEDKDFITCFEIKLPNIKES